MLGHGVIKSRSGHDCTELNWGMTELCHWCLGVSSLSCTLPWNQQVATLPHLFTAGLPMQQEKGE